MSIPCMLGFHAWHGCKCTACGKQRHDGHQLGGSACGTCRSCHKSVHTLTECTHAFWILRPDAHVAGSAEGRAVLESLRLTPHLAGLTFESYAIASLTEMLPLYERIAALKDFHQTGQALTFSMYGPESEADAHASRVDDAWNAMTAHFEIRRIDKALFGIFLTSRKTQFFPAEK